MRLSLKKLTSVMVFLLLYYIYMNSVRKIMIPMSSIVVPIILFLTLLVALLQQKGKIVVKNKYDRVQCICWIIIAILMLVDNNNLVKNMTENGMIQFYVMICFFLFATRYNEWHDIWIKATLFFVMVHAVFTIIFFYFPTFYYKFAEAIFSEHTLSDLMRFYKKGWMSGLCAHFSSNGMILAIGLIVFFEYIRELKRQKRPKKSIIISCICIVLVLYALILSSKRGPLIAALAAIMITFTFGVRKNLVKRIMLILVICLVVVILYIVFVNYIPGLSTIANKFQSLNESDLGILNGRAERWALAIDMFKSSPIVGHGYGSYEVFSANSGKQTSAHNFFLSTLAEFGIVGFIVFCAAFICGMLSVVNTLKKSIIIENKSRMILCISLEIQLFVIMYCMTATALMYYSILIPYFLACTAVRCPLGADYDGKSSYFNVYRYN